MFFSKKMPFLSKNALSGYRSRFENTMLTWYIYRQNRSFFLMNIADIDKNYAVVPIEGYDFVFYDAMNDVPQMLEGLPFGKKDKQYCRIPQDMLSTASSGVSSLAWNTSGVKLRFVSNTPAVTVRYTPSHTVDIDNITFTTRAGVDIYRRKSSDAPFIHCGTLRYNGNSSLELKNALLCKSDDDTVYEYLINFPLYGGVSDFSVGVVKGSIFDTAPQHKVEKPVLFYGSSITHGSAASRPGMNYCSRVCRAIDAEEINLGFAGNAKGEEYMAELIASLELAAFVFDYDHNAPTAEHLQNTHSRFFEIIRTRHPELPIIIMNRPSGWESGNLEVLRKRRDIIFETFRQAKQRGDENVWFIEGETIFDGPDRFDCTSDLTHPNDIGFERMYLKVLPVIKAALKI